MKVRAILGKEIVSLGMGTNLGKEKRAMFGGDGSLVR